MPSANLPSDQFPLLPSMRKTYLDNAATSCPKPPEVVAAVERALREVCANPGRGAYEDSLEAARLLLRSRRTVARFFSIKDESRVVFTLNATQALNFAIKGLLREGDHVVISSLEHNSVIRPLAALYPLGVEVTRVPCSPDGQTDPNDIMRAVRPETALVALTHASNVLGTLLPVDVVGPMVRSRGIPFLVDAAQTAGCFALDVEAMAIDLLAVPGHKGLLGPAGVGVLYVSPRVTLRTLIEGGAGGDSASEEPPEEPPDRYEAGTHNTPGIAGLAAGVQLISQDGLESIGNRERALADRLRRGLREVEGVHVYGPPPGTPAAPVVSFALAAVPSTEVAFILDRAFGIASRAGLHCAPEAHRVTGTLETGLVRLSVGYHNDEDDIEAAIEAVRQIAAKTTTQS